MNILFLSHRVPFPPNKGDKIRSFQEIKHFSRNHDIHLLSFCDNEQEMEYAGELSKYCNSVSLIQLDSRKQRLKAVASMAQGRPWTLGYYSSHRMLAEVEEKRRTESVDLAFAYSSSMAPYAALAGSIPKVIDFVDSDASKWRQYARLKSLPAAWLYAYESGRLAKYEQNVVQSFDSSVFVSPREAGHLRGKMQFIQNGIDLDYFSDIQPQRQTNTIIFTGVMDYFPNVDAASHFANETFPIIRAKLPDARFLIVGSRPTTEVHNLEAIPGVTVTGAVPDVRPYLAQSKVAVVPMRISQGIQNKILEAMAAGLPVVTTSAAAGGFSSTKDMPIDIADEPAAIAEKILEHLKTPLPEKRIAVCRDYLKQHFDWTANLSAFDQLFAELTRSQATQQRCSK